MKALVTLIAGLGIALPAFADFEITVQGTDNPWLAGMPEGSYASFDDYALENSPVLIPDISGFPAFTFSVVGEVRNGACCTWREPDGGDFYTHYVGAEHGISDVNAPINSLMGVFLTDDQPDWHEAPGMIDFWSLGLDFTSLSPQIAQVFFIGDGMTTGGLRQQFVTPDGATRLFLGTMDGYSWNDNEGSFAVTVSAVPEPSSWALLAGGIGLIGAMARRRTTA